ncbi:hypothetical protein NT239_05800 [Chitinibacter sp. SCUT-21]|uniref:hypothetical protein n=1 Tax=Chitinibacter sp. SCUT-21 TaxID=2970891 RepID=UPI0035A6D519
MKITPLAVSLTTLFLVACGGGGEASQSSITPTPASTPTPTPTPTPTTPPGTSVGVLSDSPVGGVSYSTSGGYSGTTNANGQYSYNSGETVTFKIGGITLGTVKATGTITPLELAAANTGGNSSNIATNLLVLLQSLDADGDASNGITINDTVKTQAANTVIDLTVSPATFASSSNTALTTIMQSASLPKSTPVSEADALAHFKNEFFIKLSGTWRTIDTTIPTETIIRFDKLGNYILGEVGSTDSDGNSGTEVGQIGWDPKTGKISRLIIPPFDSNGGWGLNQVNGDEKIRFDGDVLILVDVDGLETKFARITNDNRSLVGMWALGSSTNIGVQHFFFLADGSYIMADPIGDNEGSTPCSVGGLEKGKYIFNSSSKSLKITSIETDTNNCAGLWDKPANLGFDSTIILSADGLSLSLGSDTLYRVSK